MRLLRTALLSVFSKLYGSVMSVRGALYDRGIFRRYESALPVVCVGNLTAGGNGKTPLCLFLARELQSRGVRVAILSRGYGGSKRGPVRVTSNDTSLDVGDEPLVMARAGFPVYVARARAAGARLIESDGSADLIILDDGFQHRALARDVDIVSIFVGTSEAVDDFLAGHLLPRGRFREDRVKGLQRATMAVLAERKVVQAASDLDDVDPRIMEVMPPRLSVFRSYLQATGVSVLGNGQSVTPGPIVACAGIANPEGFFESLRNLGYEVQGEYAYDDHHTFSREEIAEILDAHQDVPLICTAKDAVKLAEIDLSSEARSRIGVLSVEARVAPADAFMVNLMRRIRAKLPERALDPSPGKVHG